MGTLLGPALRGGNARLQNIVGFRNSDRGPAVPVSDLVFPLNTNTGTGASCVNPSIVTASQRFTARGAIRLIKLVYAGFNTTTTGDADLGNDYFIKAGIETCAAGAAGAFTGTIIPVTFGGLSTPFARVPNGGTLESDWIGVPIESGQDFGVRTAVTVNAGADKFPIAYKGDGDRGEYLAASDVALSGAIGTFVSGSLQCGPMLILSKTAYGTKPLVGIIGNSIHEGFDDNQSGVGTTSVLCVTDGFIRRALTAQGYPYISFAKSSQRATHWADMATAGTFYRRVLCADLPDWWIVGSDYNGLAASETANTSQGLYTLIYSGLRALGAKKIIQLNNGPYASSSDRYTNAANQTVPAFESVRLAMNTWYSARLADGTIDALVDMNACWGDPANVGKYITTGAQDYPIANGRNPHPTPALHTLAATLLATYLP